MRVNKRMRWLFTIISMMMFLTGCANKETVIPVDVAIVTGPHDHAPLPNYSATVPYVNEACKTAGYVTVIVCDGKPYQSMQADIPVIKKNLTDDKLEDIANGQVKEILQILTTSEAISPEVDTLKAINDAARALKAQTGESEKWMVILDSGLSTTGDINFVGSYFQDIDVDSVIEELKNNNALPDCRNTHIVWFGLGDTLPSQPDLSSADRAVLKEVWLAVLAESGAISVSFATDLPVYNATEGERELPSVSVVDVLDTDSVIPIYDPEEVIVLDEEVLSFKAGTSELLTPPNDVQNVLLPVIEYLKKNPQYEVLLAGTTASFGSEQELRILAEARCTTVEEILLNAGVNTEQIHIVGLGYDNRFTVVDTTEAGSIIQENAQANRTVRIMDYDSELATELLTKEEP